MRLEVAVCLPRDAQTVRLVRSVVSDTLTAFGVTEDCIDDIRLALSEACTNVIDHAAADDEYEVRVEVDESQCAISIMNTGDGFDAEALAQAMPDPGSRRGRGVAIMRAVMDKVEFISQPESGTLAHLVKGLSFDDGSPFAVFRPGAAATD